jgi:hypothetical protein
MTVRRRVVDVEDSLDRGVGWTVFEPNEALLLVASGRHLRRGEIG